ncbi:uncharacterized protein LOC142984274 [Anticarsia gemmatalis]|uniref:uncharacterized protein LOC142984274 n=1 Tax=Anticarsia gemmatalis TaxID=129554 RepID=UPI003F75960C
MNINDLPLEVFIEILGKLDGCNVGKCRRVCKQWKEVIDGTSSIWEKACWREYSGPSSVAGRKCGSSDLWYYIYKNMTQWSRMVHLQERVRECRDFYKFASHDTFHALEINYGILPLRDTRGIVLYDLSSLKYLPVVVPEKQCLKISNNRHATVLLLERGILIQRNVDWEPHMTQGFFEGQDFVLDELQLYFYQNRDVFQIDLSKRNIASKRLLCCDYDIREIQYNSKMLSLFTVNGKIITLNTENNSVSERTVDCPPEWMKQIKHIRAISHKNYVCFSRNIFQIETEVGKHLYLDFPHVTALFFYGDFTLLGTRTGEILLYRLASQQYKSKPIFEKLAQLPDSKYAVQLDVCERKTGPVIIVSTFFEIFVLEIDFFPHERENNIKFSENKMALYKRLLIVRDRLRLDLPSLKSIA